MKLNNNLNAPLTPPSSVIASEAQRVDIGLNLDALPVAAASGRDLSAVAAAAVAGLASDSALSESMAVDALPDGPDGLVAAYLARVEPASIWNSAPSTRGYASIAPTDANAALSTLANDDNAMIDTSNQQATPPLIGLHAANCEDVWTSMIRSDTRLRFDMVTIGHSSDAALASLASTIRALHPEPFKLGLDRHNADFTPFGLTYIAALNLSSLTLSVGDFHPSDAQALAGAPYPIGIYMTPTARTLHVMRAEARNTFDAHSGALHAILSLPTLNLLGIGYSPLSPTEITAIQEHLSLTTLIAHIPLPHQLPSILMNPRIHTLVVDGRELTHPNAFNILVDHPSLRSLSVDYVHSPESLSTLSRAARIESVILGIGAEAVTGLPDLASMPLLREITLLANGDLALSPPVLEALCQKPLDLLSLVGFKMNAPARAAAASARTSVLRIGRHDAAFSYEDVSALDANPHLTQVILEVRSIDPSVMRLAARSTLHRLELAIAPSQEAMALESNVRLQWANAGKAAANLYIVFNDPAQ